MQTLIKLDEKSNTLFCLGDWTLTNIKQLNKEFPNKIKLLKQSIQLDGNNITHMDSAGAWLIASTIKALAQKKIELSLVNFSKQHNELLSLANHQLDKESKLVATNPLSAIQTLGKYSLMQFNELIEFANFIGEVSIDALRQLRNPFKWRFSSIMNVINVTGTGALPIVALLSFMIGIVISYQMGNQLRNYGANVFIVNLLGLSVLREFGPLITAIMVAGRTGSAYTTELGIMKINQEIDSLNTMGFSANALLIIPRFIGLLIVMPLLTMWANIFGVMGGMVMAQNMLGISWLDFLMRFRAEIPIKTLVIGLLKAPLFALIIASVGCFQGMKVYGSAESVGTRTTKSVVLAIFFIVVVDALLSVLLSKYKL